MKTCTLKISFISILLSLSSPGFGDIKNPDTFILASYGLVQTLDPAVCYDASGAQRIGNIYETLVFFDASHTDRFIPVPPSIT